MSGRSRKNIKLVSVIANTSAAVQKSGRRISRRAIMRRKLLSCGNLQSLHASCLLCAYSLPPVVMRANVIIKVPTAMAAGTRAPASEKSDTSPSGGSAAGSVHRSTLDVPSTIVVLKELLTWLKSSPGGDLSSGGSALEFGEPSDWGPRCDKYTHSSSTRHGKP